MSTLEVSALNAIENRATEEFKLMSTDLTKAQNARFDLETVKDSTLKVHLIEYFNALDEQDNIELKKAYHVRCMENPVKNNQCGYKKNITDFCEETLGIKRAQVYNLLNVGKLVELIYSPDSKKHIYVDVFTLAVVSNRLDNPEEMNDKFFKTLSKTPVFSSTKILKILSMMKRKDISAEEIVSLIEDDKITPVMSVKQIEQKLNSMYIDVKTKSNKQEDNKQEDNKQEDNKQEDNKQEDNKQEDNKQEDNKQEDNKQEDNKQEDNKQEDSDQKSIVTIDKGTMSVMLYRCARLYVIENNINFETQAITSDDIYDKVAKELELSEEIYKTLYKMSLD